MALLCPGVEIRSQETVRDAFTGKLKEVYIFEMDSSSRLNDILDKMSHIGTTSKAICYKESFFATFIDDHWEV